MKGLHAMIAVLGMCMVVLSSIALPIDDPETPYDESEVPVSLVTPVAVDMSISNVAHVDANAAVLRGGVTRWGRPWRRLFPAT